MKSIFNINLICINVTDVKDNNFNKNFIVKGPYLKQKIINKT